MGRRSTLIPAAVSSQTYMSTIWVLVAHAAIVVAADAAFSAVRAERTAVVPAAMPYQPGEFFVRELAPLRGMLLCPRPGPAGR